MSCELGRGESESSNASGAEERISLPRPIHPRASRPGATKMIFWLISYKPTFYPEFRAITRTMYERASCRASPGHEEYQPGILTRGALRGFVILPR